MTQEHEDLLLKDLCARLSYGVILNCCEIVNEPLTLISYKGLVNNDYDIDEVKPYLYPLSSITEEQSIELFKLFGISLVDSIGADYIKINECTGITFFLDKGFDIETHLDKLIDWLNKNNFDYRELIPMDLAIDATGLNIY